MIFPPFSRDVVERLARIKIHPTGAHVFAAKLPQDRLERTTSNLFVPNRAGRRISVWNTWGMVLAVGPLVRAVKAGQIVHWDGLAGLDGLRDTHFEIGKARGPYAIPSTRAKDRKMVMLLEQEIDIALDFEDGEEMPFLHEA